MTVYYFELIYVTDALLCSECFLHGNHHAFNQVWDISTIERKRKRKTEIQGTPLQGGILE